MARLFSEAELDRITARIASVEERSAGEIVVAETKASDAYAEPRAALAGALTIASGLSAYLLLPLTPVEWIFAAQLPVAIGAWWLAGRQWLLRRLIPQAAAREAVHGRAQKLFVERGLTETRDRSGVLILISELERRVEILADKGIHARVGVEQWQRDVATIASAIRGGRAAEGLLAAIERIGAELAEAFPPRADDVNELPDDVVRVD